MPSLTASMTCVFQLNEIEIHERKHEALPDECNKGIDDILLDAPSQFLFTGFSHSI